MFTVVPDEAGGRDVSGVTGAAAAPVAVSESLIDEIVREGARRMLAEALQAEVGVYLERFADQLEERGWPLVVGNGSHDPRTVLTSAGAVEVVAPWVNDKRIDPDTGERARFSSAILPAWARKTPKVTERCCRCCPCTGSRPATSFPRWAGSSARRPGCPRR